MQTEHLFTKIEEVIEAFDLKRLDKTRQDALQPLIDYVREKNKQGDAVVLNFVCTHNSRRSHFAQIWAQTAAAFFRINNVICYSGGTEATAMYPQVIQTLKDTGFSVCRITGKKNPVYAVRYSNEKHPIICFSKEFSHPFNPIKGFAAVMTCAHADENCPFIPGAEQRIPVTYEDPKLFDDSLEKQKKYHEQNMEIGREMCYVFWRITS